MLCGWFIVYSGTFVRHLIEYSCFCFVFCISSLFLIGRLSCHHSGWLKTPIKKKINQKFLKTDKKDIHTGKNCEIFKNIFDLLHPPKITPSLPLHTHTKVVYFKSVMWENLAPLCWSVSISHRESTEYLVLLVFWSFLEDDWLWNAKHIIRMCVLLTSSFFKFA